MSTIYPALNAATAGRGLPIDKYLDLAARHSFTSAEVGIEPLAEMGTEAAKELLASTGVEIASFGLPVEWRKDEQTFQDGLQQLPNLAAVAQELGATRCCTWVLPNYPTEPAESRRWIGARFKAIADIFAAHGIGFGLEFIGPKHFLGDPGHTFIYRMEDMLDFTQELGPNVGLLVDSFHWHALGSTEAALAALPAERITYVHINDAPDVPYEEVRDNVRLLPGAGVIDLCAFLGGLRSAGYSGPAGIEVLGTALANLSAEEAAAQTWEAWEYVNEKCDDDWGSVVGGQ